ncbi:hypothetical protein TNCV_2881691 [Trichonephila clavipes]|nr:hypothetical protein TNCV_2881691 [Trichonephila clavipes]
MIHIDIRQADSWFPLLKDIYFTFDICSCGFDFGCSQAIRRHSTMDRENLSHSQETTMTPELTTSMGSLRAWIDY